VCPECAHGTRRGVDVRVDIAGWQRADGAVTRRAILVDAGYVGNELDAAAARELARRLIAAADELAGLEAQR
jgi:hypothetical protein